MNILAEVKLRSYLRLTICHRFIPKVNCNEVILILNAKMFVKEMVDRR